MYAVVCVCVVRVCVWFQSMGDLPPLGYMCVCVVLCVVCSVYKKDFYHRGRLSFSEGGEIIRVLAGRGGGHSAREFREIVSID